MALRPDRVHIDSTIDHFMNHVAERGGVVVRSTVGSGAAMDQSQQVVHYATNPSGASPVGLLMNDVVNLDLTRQHENWHKEEMQLGSKVNVWRKGTVVTNWIQSGISLSAGDTAYLHREGRLTNLDNIGGAPTVGVFDSTKDQDGYAKVTVNLP